MGNWMDDVVFGKKRKKKLTKSRKVRGSFLGIGESKPTALTVSKSSSARYPDEYIPPKRKRTTIISDSGYQKPREYVVGVKTRDDIGSGQVGSKEYLRQIKLARLKEKRQRELEQAEAKRQSRISADLRSAEVHAASAKKFEQLARERKAKAKSRGRSYAGKASRSLYSLINPYAHKEFRVTKKRLPRRRSEYDY